MAFYDFEYDGKRLSDYGYIIGGFDSYGDQTISAGSEISFNMVSTLNGSKFERVSSTYESCLEATFQICKNPCNFENFEISGFEMRELMVWLNRKEFHKLKLIDDSDCYDAIYFEASFNVSRVERSGELYALELNAITNRPFALREPSTVKIEGDSSNWEYEFYDISDEEGFFYYPTTITLASGGDLSIYNSIEDRETYIGNCSAGEVITLDYPVITSSDESHEIQNDFNWNFFRIASTFTDKKNALTVSLPCTIEFEYTPPVELGL